jgi:hypothetical protein
MRARLPHELRDIIYEYLWSDTTSVPTAHYSMIDILRGSGKCLGRPEGGSTAHGSPPHLIQPAIVGPDAAMEVAESWYKTAQSTYGFAFSTSTLLGLERYLTVDHFSVGIDPADVLRISDLRLDIDELCWTPERAEQEELASYDPDHRKVLAAKSRYIGLLSRVKNKRGFQAECHIDPAKSPAESLASYVRPVQICLIRVHRSRSTGTRHLAVHRGDLLEY